MQKEYSEEDDGRSSGRYMRGIDQRLHDPRSTIAGYVTRMDCSAWGMGMGKGSDAAYAHLINRYRKDVFKIRRNENNLRRSQVHLSDKKAWLETMIEVYTMAQRAKAIRRVCWDGKLLNQRTKPLSSSNRRDGAPCEVHVFSPDSRNNNRAMRIQEGQR